MRKPVRLDEPDASAACRNKAALMEGLRAVQVIDLDLLAERRASLQGLFPKQNLPA